MSAADERTWLQKNFHIVAGVGFGAFVLLMGALQFGFIGGDDGAGRSAPPGRPSLSGAANSFERAAPPPPPQQMQSGQQAAPQPEAQPAGASQSGGQRPARAKQDGASGVSAAPPQALQRAEQPRINFQNLSNTQLADLRDDLAGVRVALRDTNADVEILDERIGQLEKALRSLIARLDAAGIARAADDGPSWDLACFSLVSVNADSAFISNRCANRTRQVFVGDRIPGLGRIEAIEQKGGQWTLLTQAGRLRSGS